MRESEIIDLITANISAEHTHLGIGDDCCVWEGRGAQCLSTDTIVAGSHFTELDDARLIGRKAAAAALSDLAAMGASPVGATLSYQFCDGWEHQNIIAGFVQELERHQCPLLGGDTVRADNLGLSVTVWGECGPAGRFVQRGHAQIADVLVVTGRLGGSLLHGRHLIPEPRILEGQWLAQQDYVHAMMDISDGLAADTPRLATASKCGSLIIGNKLPIHDDVPQNSQRAKAAFSDGEDFELLIAIDAQAWPQLYQEWPFAIPITMVGMLTEEVDAHIYEDELGRMQLMSDFAFEHRS